MKFDAQTFLLQAFPALNFADKGQMKFITGCCLIEHGWENSVCVTTKTYHGSISCYAEVSVPPKEPLCLVADDLIRILKTMSGEVDMARKENQIIITGTNSEFKLPSEPPKTFPAVETFGDEDRWTAKAQDMLDVIASVGPFAKYYASRPQLCGIFFYKENAFAVNPEDNSMGAFCKLNSPAKELFALSVQMIPHIQDAMSKMEPDDEVIVRGSKSQSLTIICGSVTINAAGLSAQPYNWFEAYVPQWLSEERSIFEIDANDLKLALARCMLLNPLWVSLYVKDDGTATISAVQREMNKQTATVLEVTNASVSYSGKIAPPYFLNASNMLKAASKLNGAVKCSYGESRTFIMQDATTFVFMKSLEIHEPNQ